MAMTENTATITDTSSEISIDSRGSGRPRFDPMVRLLHRFYEPLVLLSILDPTRGGPTYSPILEEGLDGSHNWWRKFLDQLSWICDSRQGGSTVSAVAAEASPDGPIFWLAANTDPAKWTIPHLEWVLKQLENSHDASPQEMNELETRIITRCIEFSKDKVKNYSRILCNRVGDAAELLAGKSNNSDLKLLEDLQELEKLRSSHQELCSLAYNFRSFHSLRTLSQKHSTVSTGTVSSVWSELRHIIGRLGSWSKASKILVNVAKNHPQFICGFCIKPLVSPPSIAAPAADSKTYLHSALGRMFLKPESDRLQQVRKTLDNFRVIDVSALFEEKYTDKNFRPRIHAELLLLAHFYHRNLRFFNNDKYIGCSKPSCYCCDLYIKCHPGKFVVRASHGNLWLNWRAPVPPLDDEKAQKHTQNILNRMVESIREDVVFQIESKAPPRPRVRDSTTGITSLVTGPRMAAAESLNSSDRQWLLRYRPEAAKSQQAYDPDQQSTRSGATSLNLFASELRWIRKDLFGAEASIGTRGSIETEEPSPVHGKALTERESGSSEDEIVVFRGRGKKSL